MHARVCRPANQGRSPRTRGSLTPPLAMASIEGSIPANAGDPRQRPEQIEQFRVNPRACGGASSSMPSNHKPRGQSPRMRGSPERAIKHLLNEGSIPAHAGEPLLSKLRLLGRNVQNLFGFALPLVECFPLAKQFSAMRDVKFSQLDFSPLWRYRSAHSRYRGEAD